MHIGTKDYFSGEKQMASSTFQIELIELCYGKRDEDYLFLFVGTKKSLPIFVMKKN